MQVFDSSLADMNCNEIKAALVTIKAALVTIKAALVTIKAAV